MQCSNKTLLFDHLVGERKQRRRHFEAERLSGLEVNDELEFGGLHDWKVARLLALEDATDIHTGLAIGIAFGLTRNSSGRRS